MGNSWLDFFFPFNTLSILCHFLLVPKVSAENMLIALWGFHWVVFLLLLLRSIFNFYHFPYNLYKCGFLWVHLFLELWSSWTYMSVSFPRLVRFSVIISSKKFSGPLCLFSSWDSYNVNVFIWCCPQCLLSYLHYYYFLFLCLVEFHCFLF